MHTLPVTCLPKFQSCSANHSTLSSVLYYYEKLIRSNYTRSGIILPYIRSLILHSLPVQLANSLPSGYSYPVPLTLNSHLSKQPTAIRLPFGHTSPVQSRAREPSKNLFSSTSFARSQTRTRYNVPISLVQVSPSVINTCRPPNELLRLRAYSFKLLQLGHNPPLPPR